MGLTNFFLFKKIPQNLTQIQKIFIYYIIKRKNRTHRYVNKNDFNLSLYENAIEEFKNYSCKKRFEEYFKFLYRFFLNTEKKKILIKKNITYSKAT